MGSKFGVRSLLMFFRLKGWNRFYSADNMTSVTLLK